MFGVGYIDENDPPKYECSECPRKKECLLKSQVNHEEFIRQSEWDRMYSGEKDE